MSDQLANTIGTYEYDDLVAGGTMQVVTEPVKLKSGASYVRGTVLGKVTATGEATIVNSAASDGSQTPYGILADDVDSTGESKPAVAYLTGEFNEDALVFGGTDNAATHKRALRNIGIFLKTNTKA